MRISWASSSPEELRAYHARDAAELAGDLPKDVVETELPAAGAFRGGLLFTPRDCADDAIIVYFHGGGFVAGGPETHRCVTAWLARLAGMRVLSGRYRLAPEHPFPAQREDAVAAIERGVLLLGSGAGRRGVFIAGDSAGACVSLWGLDALDRNLRSHVEGMALLYGAYGLTESESIENYGTPANGLDSETLKAMYRRLGEPASLAAKRFSPIAFAPDISEACYVLAAELDAVLDDSKELYRQLGGQEADNRFVVARGRDHGFLKLIGREPSALAALQDMACWITARKSY